MSLLKSTTSRVVKAMSLFGSLQMLTILCGVVRVKCVALLLGPAGVGLFSIFNSALTLLSTSTQLSVRTTGVREIAACVVPARAGRVKMVLGWGVILALFGVVVTVVAAPVMSYVTFGSSGRWGWYVVLALPVALMALTSVRHAALQGLDRLRDLASSSLWGVIGGLVLALPLVYFMRMDSIMPVVSVYAVTAYVSTRVFGKMPGVEPVRRGEWRQIWTDGRPMIRLGGYMTAAAVLTEAVNYVFIACLTRLGGEETVGVYQSGYTIITRYVGMIFTAIGVEYYPRLAGASGHPRRMGLFVAHEIRLIMMILLPVLVAFVPLVPLVVRLLYSNQFTDAIPYIIAAVPGTVLRGYSWCIAFVILARGDGLIYMVTESVSAVVMLAVNVAGYCIGGLTGLGVGFTLWYALYAVTVEVVYRRRYGLSLPWRPVMLTMLTLAVTSVVAWCMLSIK